MGGVRVKARLTNVVDQEFVRRGLLRGDQVRVYEADALVDARAVRTVLPPDGVSRLGLSILDRHVVEYADGRKEAVDPTGSFRIRLIRTRPARR